MLLCAFWQLCKTKQQPPPPKGSLLLLQLLCYFCNISHGFLSCLYHWSSQSNRWDLQTQQRRLQLQCFFWWAFLKGVHRVVVVWRLLALLQLQYGKGCGWKKGFRRCLTIQQALGLKPRGLNRARDMSDQSGCKQASSKTDYLKYWFSSGKASRVAFKFHQVQHTIETQKPTSTPVTQNTLWPQVFCMSVTFVTIWWNITLFKKKSTMWAQYKL